MGMGSTMAAAVEVLLDLKPLLARFAADRIVSTGGSGAVGEEDGWVEDCVESLEEERRKIEAFQRELPLCMAIVSDVIEKLKEELSLRRNPVLEQLFPAVDRNDIEVAEREKGWDISKDKTNWMSSVQLWGVDSANGDANPGSGNDAKTTKERSVDTAFLPLKGVFDEKSTSREGEKAAGIRPVLAGGPDLSLQVQTPGIMCSSEENSLFESRLGGKVMKLNSTCPPLFDLQVEQQHGPRKVRRCWSPELHRRFVSALQQLGGSEVATPKQIRELMKVDGLTNDEVKSHLQKYRLHTRRVSPAAAAAAAANRNMTVFGDLCARSSDRCFGSKMGTSQGSPKGPLEVAAAAVTCEDSCEDNDGSCSWKGYTHRSGEVETF